MTSKWIAQDSEAACLEGWDIFFLDGNDNEPEIEILDEGPTPFTSDDQAVAHVERRAAEGSDLHIRALELERSHDHRQGRNYWEDPEHTYGVARGN